MKAIRTFGRRPTLGEMRDYYARDDVLSFLYDECQVRNIEIAFRQELWPINPTSKAHLRQIIEKTIKDKIKHVCRNSAGPIDNIRLGKFSYLSFHFPTSITAGEEVIGFDTIFEADMQGWRQSFEDLIGVVKLLDDFGVCYRMKYSGVRSLHLMIPFESLPKQFNGKSILSQRTDIQKRVRDYFRRHCDMKKAGGGSRLRLAYSLNEDNGLVSLPILSEGLSSFRPWQTNIYNVTIDKPWHGDIPPGASRKMLKFLREVYNDDAKIRKEAPKQITSGLEIVPKEYTGYAAGSDEFSIEKWSARLESEEEAERVEAAWNLMTMPEAVPVLVLEKGLVDESPDVRWYLTEALQKRLDNHAVSLAWRMLLDNDQFVRISAIDVFALTGENALRAVWDIAWYTKPVHEVYVLLDKLIDSHVEPKAKAELLVGLLKARRKGPIVPLLTSVLLCYPNDAFPLLMEHFWSVSSAEELYRAAHNILHALCRMGTRFGEALLEPLSGGDTRQQTLALAGLEALGHALKLPGLKKASSEELALAARLTEGMAPPPKKCRDPAILKKMVEQAATFLTHHHADIREPSIRILGLMQAHTYLDRIRACVQHNEPSTRVAAIFALGEIGDARSIEILIEAAQNGELVERRTAIEVLGRLQAQEAQSVLMGSVSDADSQIRQAAVVALGAMEGEEVRAKLQELARSQDKRVAKAAARALYANRERRQPSEATRKRLRRIRGTASPVSDISTEMALRALPEIRPYEQAELTRLIAHVCRDYSGTRRALIIQKLMDRANDIYRLTEPGKEVWRVEHFIVEHYLQA